jgi:hypothetical protein|tara:strand:- start:6144 stop:6287 length:144 start_codon:yes stop_codon:yes gene_type:complete
MDDWIDDYNFLNETVEVLIDKLHILTEEGRYEDATIVANRIREIQSL